MRIDTPHDSSRGILGSLASASISGLDNAQVQGCAISPSYGRAYSSVGWQTIAYATPSATGGSLTCFYVFFLTDSIGFTLEKSTFPFKQPHTDAVRNIRLFSLYQSDTMSSNGTAHRQSLLEADSSHSQSRWAFSARFCKNTVPVGSPGALENECQ
jgi:hypothetical protein